MNYPVHELTDSKLVSLQIIQQHQWQIQKFWKGGGRQFISSVLIYRKCAQRNICLLHGKKRLF